MKKLFIIFILLLVSTALFGVKGAYAADKIVGNATATVTWTPIDGAQYYNVYYRGARDSKYLFAVTVPAQGNSITITYLDPSVTYYYRVSALVDTREVWQTEKVLRQGTNNVVTTTSVRGATTFSPSPLTYTRQLPSANAGGVGGYNANYVLGDTSAMTPKQGWSTVWWTPPSGGAIAYQLYFWSSPTDQHAVRDLQSNAVSVTIKSLNPARTYWYQVQAVQADGKAPWLSAPQMMIVY